MDICYNQVWVKETIDELEMELRIVEEIRCDVREEILQHTELEIIPFGLLRDIDTLESSLLETKRAIQRYMEMMESKLAEMTDSYERELSKKTELFSDYN